jgi:type II secretory pathway pseudopilin PulG
MTFIKNNNEAFTIFELLVVIILLGILSGLIATKLLFNSGSYELFAEANSLKSTINLLQTYAARYYEQKEYYSNQVMRDKDLWGLVFGPEKNHYGLIRKNDEGEKNIDLVPGPVYYNENLMTSHKKNVSYEITNRCSGSKILFNALGKPVDSNGKQCDHNIIITLTGKDSKQNAKIVITRTGHAQLFF